MKRQKENVRSRSIIKPTVAAFEVTARCPLKCRHCRAAAITDGVDPLDTAACKAILKGLAEYSKCVLIFTGGEPMMRDDIFELVAYARSLELRPVMASCGERLDRDAMQRLKDAGLLSFSFSLDGADAASHDAFRQSDGAFAMVMKAVETAKAVGLHFQINTTLTRLNAEAMDAIAALSVRLGAACWNPFILVPVGRGDAIRDLLFSPDEYEAVLCRLAELKTTLPIDVRLTCGPQFARVVRQKKILHAEKVPGCLAATEFVFISRCGNVQTCGFLEQSAGNLVEAGFDFGCVWEQSPLLCGLRDHDRYGGACGTCGYLSVCRGCRARALAVGGDAFAEDPICKLTHRPMQHPHAWPEGDIRLTAFQFNVLSAVQEPLPLCERPFEAMAQTLRCTERELLNEIGRFKADGLIRRYRAQLQYRALGKTAVLAAAAVPAEHIESVAAQVSALAGVSHNYQRGGRLNLWFTLQADSLEQIESTLGGLRREFGIPFYSFPAETVYKLDVKFDPAGPGENWFTPAAHYPLRVGTARPTELTPGEKAVLNAIQCELPIAAKPFEQMLGEVPLSVLCSLADKGVLGKIAAVLDYPRLGYIANAMFCAAADVDRIDAVGQALSRVPAVTHCYRRRAYPDWPYTLYAMLHADTLDRIAAFVQTFCREHGIADSQLLPTVREFKKSPVAILFQ